MMFDMGSQTATLGAVIYELYVSNNHKINWLDI